MSRTSPARRKLHWVCHSPSHYNDVLFRALAKSPDFDLLVHYREAISPVYGMAMSPEYAYPARAFKGPVLDWTLLYAAFSDRHSVFLTSCWQDPTSQLILLLLMILRRPYFIWNDAPTPKRRNWWKEKIRSAFLRAVFQRATKVLGAGRVAVEGLQEMGAPKEKLLNFPLCVDVNSFFPKSNAKSGNRLVIGTSARLQPTKGIDLAIRALAQLNLPMGQSFVYRIAGTGPEEKLLRRLAGEVGLINNVEFCGWLTPQELPRFYQTLDVYLHPSRFDAYGVAVVEALASGLPVIASDRTGAALDRVVPGESGFLYRTDDTADLVRALKSFLALDPANREKMRQHARRAGVTWPVEQAGDVMGRIVAQLNRSTVTSGVGVREQA